MMAGEYDQLSSSEDVESAGGAAGGGDSIEVQQLPSIPDDDNLKEKKKMMMVMMTTSKRRRRRRREEQVPPPNWFMRNPLDVPPDEHECIIPCLTSYLARNVDDACFYRIIMRFWLFLAPWAAALPQVTALAWSYMHARNGVTCVQGPIMLRVWQAMATFAFCLPWGFLFDGLSKVARNPPAAPRAEEVAAAEDDEEEEHGDQIDDGKLCRQLTIDAKSLAQRKLSELQVAESFTRLHKRRLGRRTDQELAGSPQTSSLSPNVGALHSLWRSEWGVACNEEQANLLFDLFDMSTKDEKIDVADLKQVLHHLQEDTGTLEPNSSALQMMIDRYDADEDGCLDREEFLEMVRSQLEPKMIEPKARRSLSRSMMVVIVVGLVMFIISAYTGAGLFDLAFRRDQSNIDANLHQLHHPARGVLDHFLPNDGCMPDIWIYRFQWLLIAVPLPAALFASVIVPAWLLSLHLGVALAADCVDDILRNLSPLPDGDQELKDDRLLRHEFIDSGTWERQVEHPVATLVETMRHLSDWGTAMGAAAFSYLLFAVTMIPSAIHQSGQCAFWCVAKWVTTLTFFAIPFYLAWGPATVSSACDDLVDQLNELSFVGTRMHRERTTRLRASLMSLQCNQGLGFQICGTVVDKRMLGKVIVGGFSAFVSIVTTILATARDEHGVSDTNGTQA
jgi:hypothetical protein